MPEPIDLLCFSHHRWDAATPRVAELLRRAARDRRVFYVEEAMFDDGRPHLNLRRTPDGILVAVPAVPRGTGPRRGTVMQRELINHLLGYQGITHYLLWFWSPAALAFTDHLAPAATVYDCLDDLGPASGEEQILGAADLVLAPTPMGFHARRLVHPNVHLVASGDAGDAAAWDRAWSTIERQVDRTLGSRAALQIAP
jgi:hypothetical protein